MKKLNLPNTKYNINYTSTMKKDNLLILELSRIGTHSDLFGK